MVIGIAEGNPYQLTRDRSVALLDRPDADLCRESRYVFSLERWMAEHNSQCLRRRDLRRRADAFG